MRTGACTQVVPCFRDVAPPRIDKPLRASQLCNGVTIGFIAAMAGAAATLDVEFTAARAGERKREAAAGRLELVQ